MPHLGPTELIIILVIVLVLFGVGRIRKIASELGQGIHEFRKGLSGSKKPEEAPKDKAAEPEDKAK
jgi:sec-independent protein translocase protein TatA